MARSLAHSRQTLLNGSSLAEMTSYGQTLAPEGCLWSGSESSALDSRRSEVYKDCCWLLRNRFYRRKCKYLQCSRGWGPLCPAWYWGFAWRHRPRAERFRTRKALGNLWSLPGICTISWGQYWKTRYRSRLYSLSWCPPWRTDCYRVSRTRDISVRPARSKQILQSVWSYLSNQRWLYHWNTPTFSTQSKTICILHKHTFSFHWPNLYAQTWDPRRPQYQTHLNPSSATARAQTLQNPDKYTHSTLHAKQQPVFPQK